MTLTRKFSQFVGAEVESVVGLTNGANTIGPEINGGGAVTETFPQSSPAVVKGQWLRVQPITGEYVLAQGDNAQDGEVVAICIAANAVTFTLQQAGYITSAQEVVSGLVAGDVQFLDTATPGAMVPVDASVNGQISRPVFLPDSPTSGWVLPYRPLIVGGAAPSPTPGPGTDTSLVVVNQAMHGFTPGTVLYVNTAPNSGGLSYAEALANNFNTSQAVGIVVANPAPTTNQFTLQFSGYNAGSLMFDEIGNPILGGTVYYLSAMHPGKVTNVMPTGPGDISKPIYISEQGTGNTGGIQAGYILPQRPLPQASSLPNQSPYIYCSTLNFANGYASETALLDANGNTYGAYLILFNPGNGGNTHNEYGINATSLDPIGCGLQYFINGAWFVTPGYYASYTSGVNSTAGVNTSTWWGFVANLGNGPGRYYNAFIPPTSLNLFLSTGSATLHSGQGVVSIEFNTWLIDSKLPDDVGYTSIGNGVVDLIAVGIRPTGFRLFFDSASPVTLNPASTGYITVWGIPNS